MPPKPGALLDPAAAAAFIDGYKRFLLTVPTGGRADEGSDLKTLVYSRDRVAKNPELLRDMLAQVRSAMPDLDGPVLQAIGSLRVANWVYLKETRSYAVFLDPSGDSALGVRALTQRIRDVVGTSGVFLETGIVRYCGHYVCDGLVSAVVHLGRNYLRSFTSAYRDLRTRGRFEVEYLP
jgi:hypothetical protein